MQGTFTYSREEYLSRLGAGLRGAGDFRPYKRGVPHVGAGLRGVENFRLLKRGVSRLGAGIRGAGDEVP